MRGTETSRRGSAEGTDLGFSVKSIAPNLVEREDGVWSSAGETRLSYPDGAHNMCFDIEAGSFWYVHRNEVILRAIRRHPPAGTVFDVGGGNGFVTVALRDAGFPSLLVEPGEDGVRNAVRRGLRPVLQSTIDDAGFADGSFPAAGLFDVVEHIEDDRGFLERLRKLLEPGGLLYVTVPALSWLWSSEDSRAGHYRRYTIETMASLLVTSGFTVEFATYFFGFLVWPLFVRRSIPSRLGLRDGTGHEYAAEHAPPSRRLRRLIEGWSRAELDRLDAGAPIRRGTSCILVARSNR